MNGLRPKPPVPSVAPRSGRHTRKLLVAAATVSSLLVGPTAGGPALAGSVSGTVRFLGTPPTPPTITMSADPACDRLFPQGRPADNLLVGEAGALANVLVYVKGGLPKDFQVPAPPGEVVVDQKGCAYVPHVLGVRAGQVVAIHNSDATFHNVNARAAVNTPFNDAMPTEGLVLRKAFYVAEVAVKLKCDIHPWMSAYVGVFDHPFFAVSASDGRFHLPGLPEGDYTIEAWHEVLGVQSASVEVEDDEPSTIDFSFAGN